MADTNGKPTKAEVVAAPAQVFRPGQVKPSATKIVPIQFGGLDRNLRLTLKAMKVIKDKTNIDMWAGNPFENVTPDLICTYVWGCLLHESPDISLEEVEGNFDFSDIPYYIDRLSMLYGVSMPDPETEGATKDPNA